MNQLQPLYLAGKVFASSSNGSEESRSVAPASDNHIVSGSPEPTEEREEEYATEKIILLKQLTRIERETGWKTSDRADELRKLWGF